MMNEFTKLLTKATVKFLLVVLVFSAGCGVGKTHVIEDSFIVVNENEVMIELDGQTYIYPVN